MSENSRDEMVLSYTRVRMALGVLGLMLPVVLIIGGLLEEPGIEPTISDFFHTTYRDIYVGTLCSIGVFLISYRGYRREPGEIIDDDWLATAAGASAFGMALLPTASRTGEIATVSQRYLGMSVTPVAHYLCALVFFASLAAFCFIKFARTARPARRRIYIFSGWVILASLAATSVAAAFKNYIGGEGARIVLEYRLIFWFEAVGVWAFGLSWLVKSRADLLLLHKAESMATGKG
ncbi:hypothetical protein [Pelagovum pacificum]|uniref:DUF998 domain-containing protein n=1 Tax=Pelagovum pacificum TaxID=2588711 RepID=A0A5C5GG21_9RHOB|nr:hypothetical protein [Pelagovum pacificum]QQA43402.1 hypothetical protein I8N54_02175 [Pelagovum pacificum]TNY33460.1 hypothetical protein FHY64_09355 [Pelagovum pacificum]